MSASGPSDDPLSAAGEPPDPPEATGPEVELLLETDEPEPPLTPWLADQFARVARLAGVTRGRLTLVVVDDQRMAALHDRYHADPSTTDVLSFDMREAPAEGPPESSAHPPPEGDLVLCLDQARRQAERRGHDVRVELLLYALHGLLHLLGHDDHDMDAATRMHRREDELLSRAGFGPVYGGDGQGEQPQERA